MPIFHDILIVSAIFSLFKLEIDVTYIAALLTIIGYSLNDKIVIFGRIRENLKSSPNGGGEALRDLVNRSVRQTLGRSIYTVLTVVLASACLYMLACEPLQMFALAILLGLMSGAYSSIFISTLVWLSLRARTIVSQASNAAKQSYLATRGFVTAMGWVAVMGVIGWLAIPSLMPVNAAQAANAGELKGAPLGDLTTYPRIGSDTLALVQRGDLKAAKARIKDLETAWDDAEKKMRPMSPSDWKTVDKAIDHALAQVRSGQPDQKECMVALKALLSKFANLQNPK